MFVRPSYTVPQKAYETGITIAIIVETTTIVAVGIDLRKRVIPHISIEVQTLRIAEIGIWHGLGFDGPVRAHPSAHAGGVVSSPEIVQTALGIAFFAGEVRDSDPLNGGYVCPVVVGAMKLHRSDSLWLRWSLGFRICGWG
jgi:hypothetical protein